MLYLSYMDKNNLNKNLYTSLKEIGLSDLEASLYCISLQYGPSPITELSKYLHISRPNVYKLIRSLEKHGLVNPVSKQKYTRNFMVEPPTVILEKLREKKESVAIIDNNLVSDLPDLLALYHQGEGSTKIKVLKGREQYIKVFNQSVEEENAEIQFCGSAEDFIDFVSWGTETEWIKKRLKKDILIKVLSLPSETTNRLIENDSKEKRQTKILKNKQPFSSSFMIFANKVVLWQPKAPLAVLIEDQFITKMMKSIFDSLWDK